MGVAPSNPRAVTSDLAPRQVGIASLGVLEVAASDQDARLYVESKARSRAVPARRVAEHVAVKTERASSSKATVLVG